MNKKKKRERGEHGIKEENSRKQGMKKNKIDRLTRQVTARRSKGREDGGKIEGNNTEEEETEGVVKKKRMKKTRNKGKHNACQALRKSFFRYTTGCVERLNGGWCRDSHIQNVWFHCCCTLLSSGCDWWNKSL